jgi:hypothetical protein
MSKATPCSPANKRLIGYLFNQLENGEPGSETVSLDLSVTKGVFAARLNLTEHFSRILHELMISMIPMGGA